MLVGGLSRGVRGGQTSGLLGVVCHTYLLADTTWATVYIIFLHYIFTRQRNNVHQPWPLYLWQKLALSIHLLDICHPNKVIAHWEPQTQS